MERHNANSIGGVRAIRAEAPAATPNRAQRRAQASVARTDLRQAEKELAVFKAGACAKTGIPVEHMGIIARGDELMVFDKRLPWDKLDAVLEEAGYEPAPSVPPGIVVYDEVDEKGWEPAAAAPDMIAPWAPLTDLRRLAATTGTIRYSEYGSSSAFSDGEWKTSEDDYDSLVGKVCVSVDVHQGRDGDHIAFVFSDGTVAKMYHSQNCCEGVDIEDINGDFEDLIGVPLQMFEERTSPDKSGQHESATWTFYTLRTIRGSVDIRWLGVSNGYYSERVDLWTATPAVPLSSHQQLALLREAVELREAAEGGVV